jgi:hypothetical protein
VEVESDAAAAAAVVAVVAGDPVAVVERARGLLVLPDPTLYHQTGLWDRGQWKVVQVAVEARFHAHDLHAPPILE